MLVSTSYVILFVFYLTDITLAENCEPTNGVRQSPINIDTYSTKIQVVGPLKWSFGYYKFPESASLISDGHSLMLAVNTTNPLVVSGGLLGASYTFQQLHFHWGDTNDKGSEHKINGQSYPLEMHAVHTQSTDNNTDQIVVITYFFRRSIHVNKGLNDLLDVALAAAAQTNITFAVKPFKLAHLVPPSIMFSYYTYKGSLTTPPYTESVTWIIASTAIPIGDTQLQIFRRAAQIDKGLLNNFRCLQALNNREIRCIISYFNVFDI